MKKWAGSGLAKAAAELVCLAELFRSLGPFKLKEKLQLKFYKRQAAKNLKAKPNEPGQFVSKSQFRSDLVKLQSQSKTKVVIALLTILACGRRKIDLTRMSSEFTQELGPGKFAVRLAYDKKHARPVSFVLDFGLLPQGWCPFDEARVAFCFKRLFEVENQPFATLSNKNFSRQVSFKPHKLRALAAIHRTRLGWSDATIMADIGWASSSSLESYRGLSRSLILEGRSLEEVIEWRRGD